MHTSVIFDRNNQVTADGVGNRQIISQSRKGLLAFLQLGKILNAKLNSKDFFSRIEQPAWDQAVLCRLMEHAG